MSSLDPRDSAPLGPGERDTYFRAAFEHAAIGMAIVAPDGPLLRVNRSFCDLLGRSAAELQGLTFQQITHPDDLASDLAQAHRLLAGEIPSYTLEKRYLHRDGHAVWALLSVSLVRTADGAPLHLIAQVQDLAPRKRAEAELRASETQYAEIAANVPGMVYEFVYRPDGGREFTVVSEGIRELFGVEPAAALRDPTAVFGLVHPDDRTSLLASGEASKAALTPWRWQGRAVLATGEVKWIQGVSRPRAMPDGSVVCPGLIVDVTEQRRVAQQLAVSEQRLRSLVDHNIDAVVAADLEGRFVSLNPAAESLSGYTAAELVGQPFAPLVVPEHLERVQERFRRAVGGVPQTYEAAFLHKRGRRVDMMVSAVPIVVDGQVTGVFTVIKDVTEQRHLQAQLRQAQKMEAIGRLAGGIAHDFNNLLTAILGHSEFLLDDLADGPAREDAAVIRQAAERAAGLTRQLLDFSRKQVVEPQLVELNAVVRETERLLRRTLGDGITLEADLGAVGCVLADSGQLEQVLVNLALNARDAMRDGGTLTLRTRDVVVDAAFARRHRGLRPGTYATLAVEDTGVGIPPELLTRIFEPFFTTKAVGEGTGLGLASVYGIVKQWGGYTAVASTPGAGTTFTIYLPRQAGSPAARVAEGKQRPTGTETVLVVEDEATVRRSLRRILTRHGYTILEARHGADALRLLDDASTPRIDLVVTDLAMPEMSGRELIAEFRARGTVPRMLVMSGYDQEAVMRGEALPAGMPFIEKPFTIEALVKSVRAALDSDSGRA